ncbi:MAG: SGNH/GDSL hydrolase family protein [Lentisphaeria bacterium]
MPKNFVSLGDLLPDTDMRCRVKGCKNLWSLQGDEILAALATPAGKLPDRMCSTCFETFKTLKDQEAECAAPDCKNTWTWNRFQQLEAHARGFKSPPKHLCPECTQKKQTIEPREVPCRMKNCTNTWTWSPEKQITWDKESPPQRLCDECYHELQKLKDQEIECRMRGCKRTWTWSRFKQLECSKAGENPAKPPRRLCEDCFAKLQQLEDREITCRIPQCQRTWTYNRFAQLEESLKHGSDGTTPERFCEPCFNFYKKTRERHPRCRIRGCSHTWIYTRDQQLKDWLAGINETPRKLCKSCAAEIKKYPPKEINCSVPGCEGQATCKPEEQLRNAKLRSRHQTQHRCEACEAFLASHKPQILNCRSCGAEIKWSAYEQLLVDRGNFQKPTFCPDCASKELRPDTGPDKPPEEHHFVIRMPQGGKWSADPAIAQWPPHLNHETIDKVREADLRIVALGDDTTCSAENPNQGWPAVLEDNLNRKLADEGLSAVVINAGIPKTTSAQAVKRLPRDVRPFAPHLVLLSFICADSWLKSRHNDDGWHPRLPLEKAETATRNLMRELRKNDTQAIYWTPPPIFPRELAENGDKNRPRGWAEAQQAQRNNVQSQTVRICHEMNIPILDLNARFEVNGTRSARKWMQDWYRPNATGVRNMANWIADYLAQVSQLGL